MGILLAGESEFRVSEAQAEASRAYRRVLRVWEVLGERDGAGSSAGCLFSLALAWVLDCHRGSHLVWTVPDTTDPLTFVECRGYVVA